MIFFGGFTFLRNFSYTPLWAPFGSKDFHRESEGNRNEGKEWKKTVWNGGNHRSLSFGIL
jgi:hypothetical protein